MTLLLHVATWASLILSGGLFVISFAKLTRSLWFLGQSVLGKESGLDPGKIDGMSLALQGIEYLFLAPLPFVTFSSVAGFMLFRLRSPDADEKELGTALAQLNSAKRLVVGLIAAALATSAVGRANSPDGLGLDHGGGIAVVVLALACYLRFAH